MTLYLIAHKVRGEPAFDIAERCTIGEEEGWIVSTSGHRAYPYASWMLDDLRDCSDYPHGHPSLYDDLMPADLPDHYSVSKAKEPPRNGANLLSLLGLTAPPSPPIRRRV